MDCSRVVLHDFPKILKSEEVSLSFSFIQSLRVFWGSERSNSAEVVITRGSREVPARQRIHNNKPWIVVNLIFLIVDRERGGDISCHCFTIEVDHSNCT